MRERHQRFMSFFKVHKCKEKMDRTHDKRMCFNWHTKADRRRNPFEVLYSCSECAQYADTDVCDDGDNCLKAQICWKECSTQIYSKYLCARSRIAANEVRCAPSLIQRKTKESRRLKRLAWPIMHPHSRPRWEHTCHLVPPAPVQEGEEEAHTLLYRKEEGGQLTLQHLRMVLPKVERQRKAHRPLLATTITTECSHPPWAAVEITHDSSSIMISQNHHHLRRCHL